MCKLLQNPRKYLCKYTNTAKMGIDPLTSTRTSTIIGTNKYLNKYKRSGGVRMYPNLNAYRHWPPVDLQAAEPQSWCIQCGREVFRHGKVLCERCLKFERRKRNEKRKKPQPLFDLHTGG